MIKPVLDKVLIKMINCDETTKSGIILSSSNKEKSQIAEVLEVGPGGIVDGNEVKMCINKGDRIIVGKYAGTEFEYDGQSLLIIKQSDILAIIK